MLGLHGSFLYGQKQAFLVSMTIITTLVNVASVSNGSPPEVSCSYRWNHHHGHILSEGDQSAAVPGMPHPICHRNEPSSWHALFMEIAEARPLHSPCPSCITMMQPIQHSTDPPL